MKCLFFDENRSMAAAAEAFPASVSVIDLAKCASDPARFRSMPPLMAGGRDALSPDRAVGVVPANGQAGSKMAAV